MADEATPAAVLFDMDGTLLDSEDLWGQALYALAARLGGRLTEATRQEMVGTPEPETLAILYRELRITDPDPATDRRFILSRMAELYATAVGWRPGAQRLLSEVRAAGVPTALVTATDRSLMEIALDRVLGRESFQVVVSGDDVNTPKPAPEPYALAASKLGVPIGRCVAIEDSPAGLSSARDAGAVTIGVPSDVPIDQVSGIHRFASLTELDLPVLRRLIADHG
jgi:HAD superfamily hydrolase (TIGR01509 family)